MEGLNDITHESNTLTHSDYEACHERRRAPERASQAFDPVCGTAVYPTAAQETHSVVQQALGGQPDERVNDVQRPSRILV
jgi:hypothetical protein